jgi:hypothetical protein
MHLGYSGIPFAPEVLVGSGYTPAQLLSRVSKIYVGPGESQAGDQAILDQYLADTN